MTPEELLSVAGVCGEDRGRGKVHGQPWPLPRRPQGTNHLISSIID